MDQDEQRTVSIGRIFGRAFAVMGNNPAVVFGSAFLFGTLPVLLFNYFSSAWLQGMQQGGRGEVLALLGPVMIGIVASLVLRSLVQGCLVRATVADSQSGHAGFGECVGAAVGRLLPLIVVSVLFGLAVALGLVLLIVPGVMIAIMWAVVVPVTMEERIGIGGAFGRAADLSRGARWKILGLFLLILVIAIVIGALIGLASVALIGLPANSLYASLKPIGLAINALSNTINIVLWSTLQAALYVELRDWKDGPATQALGEIFQ